MLSKIKQIKSISIKNQEKIYSISTSGLLKSVKFNNNISKYNLVIICAGYKSSLIKSIFNDQMIENSYKESAVTAILSHSSTKNNVVRQIFFKNEIFALLPISNTKTSIVWSVKHDMLKKNNLFLKKKIIFYTKNYLKNVKFTTNIEHKDLNFLIRNKYYLDRILLFGDALHMVHPFVGQGFNMTLRDLISLEKILTQKINLGLDIGSSDVLSEFSNEVKPGNIVYSLGIDLIKNIFSFKNESFKKFRNQMIGKIDKNKFIKNLFFNLADKGVKF